MVSSTRLLGLGLLFLSMLPACDDDDLSDVTHRMSTASFNVPAGSGPLQTTQTVRRRYIALMSPTAGGFNCPVVSGWDTSPLFTLTQEASMAWEPWFMTGQAMPDVLARFCVYFAAPALTPTLPPSVPGAVRVDPDLSVVTPQGLAQARAANLLGSLGARPSGPAVWNPYEGDPNQLPYIAIIDTADSTPPGIAAPKSLPTTWQDRHRHGLTMAALIDATRCPFNSPQCLARQFRAQAFPFEGPNKPAKPVASAGQWASLGSLASAIGESVIGWRLQPDSETAPLILNLSVAWDPAHGTIAAGHESLLDPNNPDASVPATVQAVHSALAWASCQGAITVAAAGNTRGGSCTETGALAPASWEGLPAISASTCGSIAAPWKPKPTPSLAYGVGGVASPSEPIVNARPGSVPARVLYAHQASVAVGGKHTEAWTGTSIAAAAMSALVASVRSYVPELQWDTIVDTIDEHGTPSGIDAAWIQPGVGHPNVLRYDEVFDGVTGSSYPYGPGHADVHTAIVDELSAQPSIPSTHGLVQLSPALTLPTCAGVPMDAVSVPGAPPAPSGTASNDELRPQPHVPICPTCPVVDTQLWAAQSTSNSPHYELHLRIDPAYQGTVQSITLTLYDPATTQTITLPTSALGSLSAPVDLAKINLPSGRGDLSDWIATHQVRRAALTFSVGQSQQPMQQAIDVIRK